MASVIASAVAGVGSYLSLYLIAPLVNMQTYIGVFTQALGAGIIGVAIYMGVTWIQHLEETKNILKLLKSFYLRTIYGSE